jgi:hypothetical protein
MFGMLDYRASKLYLIIFGIPYFILTWLSVIGLPFLYYFLGYEFASGRFLQIVITIISYLLLGLVFAFLIIQIDKLTMFLFNLLVDIIPAEGRNKEEADAIVKGGDGARFLWHFNKKHPKDWSDEEVSYLCKGFFNFFFIGEIKTRCNRIREYFTENPEITPSQWNVEKFLQENGLKMGTLEQCITNPLIRNTIIQTVILVYLIIFNPFG